MNRTPEQVEASDALHAAIRKVVETDGNYEGELLTDWMVVYACAHPTHDDRNVYGTAYPDGHLADHICLGLLEEAKLHLIKEREEE